MKKTLLIFKTIVLSALFFMGFIFSSNVIAQEEPAGLATFCLKIEKCSRDELNPPCKNRSFHRVKLSFVPDDEFYNNLERYSLTKVYIIECLDVTGEDSFSNQVCTSGNPDLDIYLFGEDKGAWLANNLSRRLEHGAEDSEGRDYNPGEEWHTGYEFKESLDFFTKEKIIQSQFSPIMSSTNGTIGSIEWESFTPGVYSRKFYAVYEINSDLDEKKTTVTSNEAKTQQQGTLLITPQPTRIVEGEEVCSAIEWDPFGRVFDSRSLEPIFEAVVELQRKRDNGLFTKVNPSDPGDVLSSVLKNPYITENDGYFSFIVKDGTYKLDLPYSYNRDISIVTDTAQIHPNYLKIYSDIYPGQTGIEIIQLGNIQHRDVPVETKGEPANYPVKLMSGSYNLGKQSGKLYVSGRASHPFTMIKAYSKKISSNSTENIRSQLLQTISSDNFGRFSIIIDQNNLKKDEYFGEIELEKTDLTTFQLSGNKKIVEVNPILNYIEGYVYNEKGRVIPNATVSLYFTFSSKPFYQTQADDKGYYRISSVNLPSISYDIRYLLPNGQVIETDTTKFINSNAQYLKTGRINLYEQNNKVKTPSLPLKSTNLNNQQPTDITSDSQPSSKNDMILIAIVILVLILGAVALIGVYLYQKNKKPPSF